MYLCSRAQCTSHRKRKFLQISNKKASIHKGKDDRWINIRKKKTWRKSKTNHTGRKLTWTVCICGDWITNGCGVWITPCTCTVWPEGNCTRVTAGEPLPVPDPATETCKNDHHWGLRLANFLFFGFFFKERPFTVYEWPFCPFFLLLLSNDKHSGVLTIRRWLLSWNSHSLMW